MERAIWPKNTLKGTKSRENCQTTDLHLQTVSELAKLILIFHNNSFQ